MTPDECVFESIKQRLLVLKDKLNLHGYNEQGIRDRKIDIQSASTVGMSPIVEHRCRARDPLNTLVKLFLAGLAVGSAWAREVFSRDESDSLIDIDILRTTAEGALKSNVRILPFRHHNFICDYSESGAGRDTVYAPGNDSMKLAGLGLPGRFHNALDLGCGSGIQAIVASERCDHITGVDINSRALYFSSLNLILNAIDNVEFVSGDVYAPVQPDRFDLIIANPPYVICPSDSATYRDGGPMGDAVLKKIMEGLPSHLNAGGYCQIVTVLSEFEEVSHETEIREFARLHGYETLILSGPEFDSDEFARDQYCNVTSGAKDRSVVVEFLDHLDAVKFVKGSFCIVTFKNSGKYRYERMFALNRPVVFDLAPARKLKQFYEL